MNTIDLTNKKVDGGYFLLNGENVGSFKWPEDAGGDCHFVGTYKNSGCPIRDAVLDMVKKAERTIFIASFVVGDEALLEALIDASRRLVGGVYIITSLDERMLKRGIAESEDEDISLEERGKQFDRLTTSGIYVRGHENFHAKFVVVDDKIALVGSANLVANAFDWTGEANLIVREARKVRQLSFLFTELWYEGCEWDIPPGESYSVSRREQISPPVRTLPPVVAPGNMVWTRGETQTSLLQAIQSVIGKSRQTLIISTYSLVGMTEKPSMLVEPVKKAIARDVHVHLFLRQKNAFMRQRKEVEHFHGLGVSVHADTRNHAKVVLSDGKEAVLFSANFDGTYGLDAGVEVGMYLPQSNAVCDLNEYIEHAIQNADTVFSMNPTLKKLNGMLAARWCRKCPLPDKTTVKCSSQDWQTLLTETQKGPVLFEKNPRNIHLFAGGGRFNLTEASGEYIMTLERADQNASERLEKWLSSVRRSSQGNAERGFCSSNLTKGETV